MEIFINYEVVILINIRIDYLLTTKNVYTISWIKLCFHSLFTAKSTILSLYKSKEKE